MRGRLRIRVAGVKPEAALERAVCDYLALDGWRSLKTDPVSDRSRGKGFGELGMADHKFWRYQCDQCAEEDCEKCLPAKKDLPGPWRAWVQMMWIEFKTPTGRVEPHQRDWHQLERARGAFTLIAGVDFPASTEGFCSWYAQSGLARRKLRVAGTPPRQPDSNVKRRFTLAPAKSIIQRKSKL